MLGLSDCYTEYENGEHKEEEGDIGCWISVGHGGFWKIVERT